MTARPHRQSAYDQEQNELALTAIGAAALVFSAPAVLVGWALSGLVWRGRWWWALAGAAGVGLTALIWGEIASELSAGWAAFAQPGELGDKLAALWPHARIWWLWTLALTPAFALVIDWSAPAFVDT